MRSVDSAYAVVEPFFRRAYTLYPSVPRGFLEAVAYYYTRFAFVPFDERDIGDAEEIPKTYGVMGLTLDGKGVFRNNLILVSELSGVPLPDILSSPQKSVAAYAAAFAELQKRMGVYSDSPDDYIPILLELSELPFDDDLEENFAMQSYLYSVFEFMSDYAGNSKYGVPRRNIDMKKIFGSRLELHSAPKIQMSGDGARAVPDYEYAIWNPAGSCNYTTMQSRNISAVTIHYTSGTYAGSIAWFQNCTYNGVGAQASAHYVIRSSDGQITQMVREKDKAWHVRTENGYTIGIEHEAYGNVYSFFTPAMYNASAELVRDICARYQINPHRTFYRDTLDDGTCLNVGVHSLGGEAACTKIRGHQHFPNQTHTDPGPYWDWNYYYKLLNPNPEVHTFTAATGVLTDSGGEDGDYGCDERILYLIEVPDAKRIALKFANFDLEKNYDFLWIYDGNSLYSPLLGRWNSVSPGVVTSSSNALLLEFRSDCATTASGWKALWEAEFDAEEVVYDTPPQTEIRLDENKWQTKDFSVEFKDVATAGVKYSFYQVIENDGSEWRANGKRGFLCSNFDQPLANTDWKTVSGNWKVLVHRLEQTDVSAEAAVIAIPFNPTESDVSLYDVYANVLENGAGACGVGIYFCADDKNAPQNGYYLEILPTEKKMKLYRLRNGVTTVLKTLNNIVTNLNQYYLYRICHDRKTGIIKLFRHNNLLMQVGDGFPPAISNGFFMLQTNNCRVAFDNLRAYRSRSDNVVVTVGSGNQKDVTSQAVGGVSKCKVKSIIIDENDNFSSLSEKKVLVDYTAPPKPKWVKVEPWQTNLSVYDSSPVKITWESVSELHSAPVEYSYQITEVGVGGKTVASKWTDVGGSCEVVVASALDKGKSYIVRVVARNQAGLSSAVALSSQFVAGGHVVHKTLSSAESGSVVCGEVGESPFDKWGRAEELLIYPNPASAEVTLSGACAGARVGIYGAAGGIVRTCTLSGDCKIDVSGLPRGMYVIKVENAAARFVKY